MIHGSFHPLHAPRWQWWFVLVFGALTLLCGSVGIRQYEHLYYPEAHHGLSPIYHAAQMLMLHAAHFDKGVNGWIEAGRWFGVLTLFTATGALLGMRLRHELRLLRLTGWTDHHVICGLGHKGFGIAVCLKEHDATARVVALDPQPDPYLADKCEEQGICVIAADAAQAKALKQARVAHAREVIVITPTDETNLRIAAELRSQQSVPKGGVAACHVHLSDIHLREALQQWMEADKQNSPRGALRFFDVFDHEARRVLNELPLDGAGIAKDDPRSVHVVILGFGRMGRSLALRAAKMGHFANGQPLRLSVIDRKASQQLDRFLFRYPVLQGGNVCQLNFYTAEAESLAARKLVDQWASATNTLLHVFICLDDNTRGLEVALRFQQVLGNRPDSNLLLRIHSHESLAALVESAGSRDNRIKPFGMVEDAGCVDALRHEHNEALARAIHEQFARDRLAGSQRRPENDPAVRVWEELFEDIRESNRQQADHVAIKLRAIGCKLLAASAAGEAVTKLAWDEIELLAPLEHARWNAERWIANWRYGTPSDKKHRISEYLVPWADLPESIRKYDEDSVANIPLLLQQAKPPLKVVRADKPSAV